MSKTTGVFLCVLLAIVILVFMSLPDAWSHGWDDMAQSYVPDGNPAYHDNTEYRHFHVGGPAGQAYSCKVNADSKIYADSKSDADFLAERFLSCPNIQIVGVCNPDPDEDAPKYYVCFNESGISGEPITPTPTPTPTPTSTATPTPTPTSSPTVTTTIEKILDNAQDSIPEDVVVPDIEMPMLDPELCNEERVERVFYKGYTFYTPSVLSQGIETLADLWERNWFTGSTGGAFYVVIDSSWLVYRGDGDVGNIPLRSGIGILVYQATNGTQAGLTGCPVTSLLQIELNAGMNLIGFPLVPDTIQRPSDLLSDTVLAVIVSVEGVLKLVARAGDAGDDLLVDGQGLMVIATQSTTINLDVASAPRVRRVGTLATSWGGLKRIP